MRSIKVVFTSLLCLVFFLAGCSKKEANAPEAPQVIEMKSAADLEKQLSSTGWQTQTTSAASFHLWEQLNPTTLILAENRSDECLVIGSFSSEEQAQKAYHSLVPTNKDTVTEQNTDGYLQAMVTLADNEGVWLFRQIGTWVLGGCAPSERQASGFDALFNSFQQGQQPITPQTGSEENTGPDNAGAAGQSQIQGENQSTDSETPAA